MPPEFYSIEELSQASDIRVRNIRYYIAEGLLDPPTERGKYTQSHLIRLRFIRQLSQHFVRLEQIRRELQRTDAEIEALLNASAEDVPFGGAAESPQQAAEAPGESARRYIAQALNRAPAAPPQEANRAAGVFDSMMARAPKLRSLSEVEPARPPEETYQRIQLDDGLELHTRTPITPERQSLIDRLVALARKPRTR